MTLEEEYRRQSELFPNPERIVKVRVSASALTHQPSQQGVWASFGHPHPQKSRIPFRTPNYFTTRLFVNLMGIKFTFTYLIYNFVVVLVKIEIFHLNIIPLTL